MSDELDRKNEEDEIESIEIEGMDSKESNLTEAFWKNQIGILRSSIINSAIILINIIIFIYSLFAGEDFVSKFDLRSDYVMAGIDYYRVVTSMFFHVDFEHIFSNMLILFFVGANIEYDIGHIPYLLLYFFSGIAGNLVSIAYDVFIMEFVPSIGASGAVFGVIGAVLVVVLFGRKNLRKGSNLMVRLGLMIILSVYNGFTVDNVNNAAHIGGLLGGILITLLITLIMRKQYTLEEWL